ncbi:DUF4390 domain-containing protein [Diaphorobacter aerolatus]|uniref:DUF4390 domain-containing protein n=2 Tax=Diaphorobacter aerolatus TaxID=1288495 RepID=A0A7H0GQJ7_9BURK|nr:DUF4390 domain-containing protein [Diaphorobacter aerolatus]
MVLCMGVLLCLLAPVPGFAQSNQSHAEITDFRLVQSADGLLLSTTMRFELPDQVQDALYKGIAMYFVAETQIVRERWYWSDKAVAQATRHMRLSYQPLTRRWRLSQSSAPFADSGLGVSLGQNFEELGDALAVMQRISRWNVASTDDIQDGGQQTLHFQFRLDMSQLPRPLQLSTVGRSGWSLLLSRSVRLTSSTVETDK